MEKLKEIEKEAYKRIPFEILLYVADFCEKNQIRYSLAYGTLLGAIRHKGFIPWDDDIDIIMPRSDFERFKSLYHSDRYPLSDISINENHATAMAKVYDSKTVFHNKWMKRDYGLFIDVFVVDNFPSEEIERIKWQKRIRNLITINNMKNICLSDILHSNLSFLSIMKKLLLKALPVRKKNIQKEIVELSQKYNKLNTKFVGITMSQDNPFDLYPSDFFEKYIDIEFENHSFKAIRQYDTWLRICYGDYMQLPPVEKRVGKHGIKAFYK